MNQRGQPAARQDLERTVSDLATKVLRLTEQVDVLRAVRGDAGKPDAAVLRGDLAGQIRSLLASGDLVINDNWNVVVVTADYTAKAGDYVLVDASGGNVTVYMPDAKLNGGKKLAVKRIDASGNTVTIDATGKGQIDGANTDTLPSQWDANTMDAANGMWVLR